MASEKGWLSGPLEKLHKFFGSGSEYPARNIANIEVCHKSSSLLFSILKEEGVSCKTKDGPPMLPNTELCQILETKLLKRVASIWTITRNCYNSVRTIDGKPLPKYHLFFVLLSILKGKQLLTSDLRMELFEVIEERLDKGEEEEEEDGFGIREGKSGVSRSFQALVLLTVNGKKLVPFSKRMRIVVGCLLARATDIQTTSLVEFFTHLIQYNASHLGEACLIHVLNFVCRCCDRAEVDLAELCLGCFRILLRDAGVTPRFNMEVLIAALCRTLNQKKLEKKTWEIVSLLLSGPYAHSCIFSLCSILDSAASAAPSLSRSSHPSVSMVTPSPSPSQSSSSSSSFSSFSSSSSPISFSSSSSSSSPSSSSTTTRPPSSSSPHTPSPSSSSSQKSKSVKSFASLKSSPSVSAPALSTSSPTFPTASTLSLSSQPPISPNLSSSPRSLSFPPSSEASQTSTSSSSIQPNQTTSEIFSHIDNELCRGVVYFISMATWGKHVAKIPQEKFCVRPSLVLPSILNVISAPVDISVAEEVAYSIRRLIRKNGPELGLLEWDVVLQIIRRLNDFFHQSSSPHFSPLQEALRDCVVDIQDLLIRGQCGGYQSMVLSMIEQYQELLPANNVIQMIHFRIQKIDPLDFDWGSALKILIASYFSREKREAVRVGLLDCLESFLHQYLERHEDELAEAIFPVFYKINLARGYREPVLTHRAISLLVYLASHFTDTENFSRVLNILRDLLVSSTNAVRYLCIQGINRVFSDVFIAQKTYQVSLVFDVLVASALSPLPFVQKEALLSLSRLGSTPELQVTLDGKLCGGLFWTFDGHSRGPSRDYSIDEDDFEVEVETILFSQLFRCVAEVFVSCETTFECFKLSLDILQHYISDYNLPVLPSSFLLILALSCRQNLSVRFWPYLPRSDRSKSSGGGSVPNASGGSTSGGSGKSGIGQRKLRPSFRPVSVDPSVVEGVSVTLVDDEILYLGVGILNLCSSLISYFELPDDQEACKVILHILLLHLAPSRWPTGVFDKLPFRPPEEPPDVTSEELFESCEAEGGDSDFWKIPQILSTAFRSLTPSPSPIFSPSGSPIHSPSHSPIQSPSQKAPRDSLRQSSSPYAPPTSPSLTFSPQKIAPPSLSPSQIPLSPPSLRNRPLTSTSTSTTNQKSAGPLSPFQIPFKISSPAYPRIVARSDINRPAPSAEISLAQTPPSSRSRSYSFSGSPAREGGSSPNSQRKNSSDNFSNPSPGTGLCSFCASCPDCASTYGSCINQINPLTVSGLAGSSTYLFNLEFVCITSLTDMMYCHPNFVVSHIHIIQHILTQWFTAPILQFPVLVSLSALSLVLAPSILKSTYALEPLFAFLCAFLKIESHPPTYVGFATRSLLQWFTAIDIPIRDQYFAFLSRNLLRKISTLSPSTYPPSSPTALPRPPPSTRIGMERMYRVIIDFLSHSTFCPASQGSRPDNSTTNNFLFADSKSKHWSVGSALISIRVGRLGWAEVCVRRSSALLRWVIQIQNEFSYLKTKEVQERRDILDSQEVLDRCDQLLNEMSSFCGRGGDISLNSSFGYQIRSDQRRLQEKINLSLQHSDALRVKIFSAQLEENRQKREREEEISPGGVVVAPPPPLLHDIRSNKTPHLREKTTSTKAVVWAENIEEHINVRTSSGSHDEISKKKKQPNPSSIQEENYSSSKHSKQENDVILEELKKKESPRKEGPIEEEKKTPFEPAAPAATAPENIKQVATVPVPTQQHKKIEKGETSLSSTTTTMTSQSKPLSFAEAPDGIPPTRLGYPPPSTKPAPTPFFLRKEDTSSSSSSSLSSQVSFGSWHPDPSAGIEPKTKESLSSEIHPINKDTPQGGGGQGRRGHRMKSKSTFEKVRSRNDRLLPSPSYQQQRNSPATQLHKRNAKPTIHPSFFSLQLQHIPFTTEDPVPLKSKSKLSLSQAVKRLDQLSCFDCHQIGVWLAKEGNGNSGVGAGIFYEFVMCLGEMMPKEEESQKIGEGSNSVTSAAAAAVLPTPQPSSVSRDDVLPPSTPPPSSSQQQQQLPSDPLSRQPHVGLIPGLEQSPLRPQSTASSTSTSSSSLLSSLLSPSFSSSPPQHLQQFKIRSRNSFSEILYHVEPSPIDINALSSPYSINVVFSSHSLSVIPSLPLLSSSSSALLSISLQSPASSWCMVELWSNGQEYQSIFSSRRVRTSLLPRLVSCICLQADSLSHCFNSGSPTECWQQRSSKIQDIVNTFSVPSSEADMTK